MKKIHLRLSIVFLAIGILSGIMTVLNQTNRNETKETSTISSNQSSNNSSTKSNNQSSIKSSTTSKHQSSTISITSSNIKSKEAVENKEIQEGYPQSRLFHGQVRIQGLDSEEKEENIEVEQENKDDLLQEEESVSEIVMETDAKQIEAQAEEMPDQEEPYTGGYDWPEDDPEHSLLVGLPPQELPPPEIPDMNSKDDEIPEGVNFVRNTAMEEGLFNHMSRNYTNCYGDPTYDETGRATPFEDPVWVTTEAYHNLMGYCEAWHQGKLSKQEVQEKIRQERWKNAVGYTEFNGIELSCCIAHIFVASGYIDDYYDFISIPWPTGMESISPSLLYIRSYYAKETDQSLIYFLVAG